ncbi:MAG: cysteine-rich CWC family protein [Fibrobacteres bacterium]|nr:cysteine-rich CWC family protein [Fibrobacterota bacterium]
MSENVNDRICPVCGKANGCQAGDPDCWCNTESVPQGLRDLVPAHLAMKACICRACVVSYKADPAGFAAGR